MNGGTNAKLVLDTNIIINFINKNAAILPGTGNTENPQYFVSVITEMEILANPNDTEEARKDIQALLSKFTIVPLNDEIKSLAIEIRRAGSPRPKLPDAIVAATAVVLDAELVTNDTGLFRLTWPGLKSLNI
jgi:predicted nucleic acid-binding protein